MTPVMIPNARYATAGGRLEYLQRLVEKVQNVPGVTAVGMVSNVPLSHAEPANVRIEGESFLNDAETPMVDVFWVSPDYFRALEIPLQRGRFLTLHDGVEEPPAVLVSQSFAYARFARTDPIGRRIQLGTLREPGPWLVIAGVVGDVRYDRLDRDPRQAVYLPQALNPFHYTRLVARTAGSPWRFERAIRAAMRDTDPTIAIFHVQPMDDYVASSLAARSFALALLSLFGALALVLSAVGVYGLVSYSVVQRTPELGLRAALGATTGNLLALIAWHGIGLAGAGLGLGMLAGLGLTRLLTSFLYGVGPADVPTLAAAASLLFAVAGLASYLPARSAARVDPLEALRAD
jgi:predicted permease